MTVEQLIDYLAHFDGNTLIFLHDADVTEPCEYIALDSIPWESEVKES